MPVTNGDIFEHDFSVSNKDPLVNYVYREGGEEDDVGTIWA